ncbi:acyl transferase [Capnocytophaga sp. ARDL2]|uniref:LuxE/PaaK family acyltransferase n=1 Tax=Capnocytophaga sp. ARDL2 TaxID=3238809 RepID=UPI00355661D4
MFSKEDVFSIQTKKQFHKIAMKVFRFQYENNQVYKEFCDLVKKTPSNVSTLEQIPFLPIEFFKTKKIVSTTKEPQEIFTSSGTTGQTVSKHYVSDLSVYEESFLNGFQRMYGAIENYTILALLPSYLERQGSSLIYMVERMIKESGCPHSGFYLHNYDELVEKINLLENEEKNTLLIGVSYALMNLIETHIFELQHTIVMETGGMKGMRKELVREELHELLKKGFGVEKIHSEYGMTEMLSQGYSLGDGIYECPPWMDVIVRDTEDPFSILSNEKTGGVNIIDLANFESISFIATQDLGRKQANGTFEIHGRFDNSDIRGCNLMVV